MLEVKRQVTILRPTNYGKEDNPYKHLYILLLRPTHARQKLGVGKTTFQDWQNPKSKRYRPDFPKKIQLGANSVGYLESEINAFIHSLANSRTV